VRFRLKKRRRMREKTASKTRPWYEAAFAREYLSQYAHRSDDAARQEVPFVAGALNLRRGARVFDLCCGAGRHSRALAGTGLRVVGMDLSADLLRAAAEKRMTRTAFVRGDMRRLPFQDEAFDGLVNLFTSFGYFMNDAENQRVLNEAARVLKPGAPFLMDFFNIKLVRRNLVPRSERAVEGMHLRERRWYDLRTRRLNKTTQILRGDETSTRRESVRGYTRAELTRMFKRAGLAVTKVYGDLSGAKFDERLSPRCVLLARKARGGSR